MKRLLENSLTTGGESHVRVVPGASPALGFSTDMCATGGMAVIVVMRPARPIGART